MVPATAVIHLPYLKYIPLRRGECVPGSFGATGDVHRVEPLTAADKAFRVVLVVVHIHKPNHPLDCFGPHGILMALPGGGNQVEGFRINFIAYALEQPVSGGYTADTILPSGLVVGEPQSGAAGCLHKGGGRLFAGKHQRADFCAGIDLCCKPCLLGEQQGFIFHAQARVDLAKNRQVDGIP